MCKGPDVLLTVDIPPSPTGLVGGQWNLPSGGQEAVPADGHFVTDRAGRPNTPAAAIAHDEHDRDRCSYVLPRCSGVAGRPVMGHSAGEGRLLSGQVVAGDGVGVAGRQIVRKTAVGVRHFVGQARDPRGWLRAREVLVDLAGDVALEDAHDLGLGGPSAR